MMSTKVRVLDHGYLKVIEAWGSDERIVETARMSTGKGFLGWDPGLCPACDGSGQEFVDEGFPPGVCLACEGKGKHPGDAKLLKRLYEKRHSTPFEFAGMTVEVQAPIMVFREWHRHRTQSYSEKSARYAPLPAIDYMPTPERVMMNVTSSVGNKQAGAVKGSDELTLDATLAGLAEAADVYEHCERVYQANLKRGFPKEIARLVLTVARYSAMRASTDLRNWLGFATLRLPSDAQWEIRQFAGAVHDALAAAFPRTTALFDEAGRGP